MSGDCSAQIGVRRRVHADQTGGRGTHGTQQKCAAAVYSGGGQQDQCNQHNEPRQYRVFLAKKYHRTQLNGIRDPAGLPRPGGESSDAVKQV